MINDQQTIEMNMYKKIFFLFFTKLLATIVPTGILMIQGVTKAIPASPYFFQILIILRLRFVKILFEPVFSSTYMYLIFSGMLTSAVGLE